MNPPISAEAPDAETPARQRLPAHVRINQILDAALEAFIAEGFASTRIDDIARLAGISKGGIYTHFKSKDELFEALLERSLTPLSAEEHAAPLDGPVTVNVLIERVIDRMYEHLANRRTVQTLRLLVADGTWLPQRVAKWRRAAIEPFLATIEKLMRIGVAQGTLREGVLTKAPWLLVAPGVYAAFWQLIEEEAFSDTLVEQRRLHIAMARELLQPVSEEKQG
jgi:AcrR family transcriptional regulator